MDSSELLARTLLKERIKLEPRYLTANFRDELLNRLKLKVEGICTKHGFISKNSIDIYKVAPGIVEIASLNGNVVYDVYFYGNVCNPLIGSIIKSVKVVNLNRFGILAEARFAGDKYASSILEIIIAKNSVNIVSEIDLESIKIDDDINIEVVGKKFNIGDRKISVIGKIVKDIKKEPKYKVNQHIIEDDDDDDPTVPDIDGLDDGDEDEDGEDKEDKEEKEEDGEDKEEEEDEIDAEVEDEEEGEEAEKIGGSDFFSDHDDEYDNDVLSDIAEDDGVGSDAESL
jgi:DNA-directed RNA polymerase subunit E'/Rpb7